MYGLLAWLGAGLACAQAADLQVTPVLVEFAPAQQAQALYLANSGQQPLQAQVRVLQWSQEDGQEHLEPTRDVIASPAIVEVGPGQRQIVRLIRLQPSPATRERSYRVLVDELPGAQRRDSTGLQFLLRYSIPVFVQPLGPVAPGSSAQSPEAVPPTDLAAVQARLQTDPDGRTRLLVRNEGSRRLRISHLAIADEAGASRRALGEGLLGYVLSGQQMSWPLDLPLPLPAGQTLKARFNDDMEAQALPLVDAGR